MTTRKIEPHSGAVSELEDGTMVEVEFPDEEDSGENVLDCVSPRKLLIQEWDDLPTNTGDARTDRFVSSIHGNRLSTLNQEVLGLIGIFVCQLASTCRSRRLMCRSRTTHDGRWTKGEDDRSACGLCKQAGVNRS
jgi:hypothetical protein